MCITAMKQALEALEGNRLTHLYCEDNWYSCPKHEEGCANDAEGDECNCGADEANVVIDAAITSLRQAIAEAEKQEPVAWMNKHGACISAVFKEVEETASEYTVPLYTSPPQRQPLTDEQIGKCIDEVDATSQYGHHHFGWHLQFARAIEAAHGIKE